MDTKRVALALSAGIAALALLTLLGLLAGSGALPVTGDVALAAASRPADETPIHYVAASGVDGGDCATPEGACRTIQYAVDRAAAGDELRVASGVYTGANHYAGLAQVVYLSKTLTIRGGYTISDWLSSDAQAHPTVLDAEGEGRVVYVGGSISATLDGLRITGGAATGLGGAPGPAKDDAGGGIYVVSATATLRDNWIYSNTAWFGGGAFLLMSAGQLQDNRFSSNNGHFGGGLSLYNDQALALVRDNSFTGNSGYIGGGLSLWFSQATLDGNLFTGNSADYCGGLESFASDAALYGNQVVANAATVYWGGGMCIRHGGPALLRANYLSGNVAGDLGGGLYLFQNDATLVNNVIADNAAGTRGSGLYIEAADPDLLHTTLARNRGGEGSGVYVTGGADNGSSVAMTNTIVFSHAVGVAVSDGNGVALNGSLWYRTPVTVSLAAAAVATVSNAHVGDPAFDLDGYHILSTSAAIDAGVPAGVNTDIDGQHRPYGNLPDLGADEFAEGNLFLPIVLKLVTGSVEPPEPPEQPPAPAGFARWRSGDGAFSDWERDGLQLGSSGTLQLDPGTAEMGTDPFSPGSYFGHNFYNGGAYWVGEASSPVMTAPISFGEAVAAWNADTPQGTWMETLARVRLGERWTGWYNMGVWAAGTDAVARHSVSQQNDGDGRVAVDTLVVTNQSAPVEAYQLKVRLFSADGVATPSVRNMSFAFSETLSTTDLPPGNPALWDTVLPVPECSQMVYPDGGTVWCSPTSTAMVLKYWLNDDGPCEPDVRAAVAGVYDWLYDGHGNWPFNTAYAATQGLEAYVARFTSLAQLEEWIAADVPVVFSLAWGVGELTGAPLPSSDGHLMVLVGFDAAGNPVLNDPAAASNDSVRRTYLRREFEPLWLEHTNGTVYLIYPSGWPVPDL
jgi:hypothetical protein